MTEIIIAVLGLLAVVGWVLFGLAYRVFEDVAMERDAYRYELHRRIREQVER